MIKIECDRCSNEIVDRIWTITFTYRYTIDGEEHATREHDLCFLCEQEVKNFVLRKP